MVLFHLYRRMLLNCVLEVEQFLYFMENPIKMDDLGVPPFMEPPISWLMCSQLRDLWYFSRARTLVARCL